MFGVIKKISEASRKKMMYLLITLVSLVVLDGLLTEYLMDGGRVREANPFLEGMVGQTGFMILKVVGSLLCAFILWDIYRRYPRLASVATWIAVAGYGIIVIWNTSLCLLT